MRVNAVLRAKASTEIASGMAPAPRRRCWWRLLPHAFFAHCLKVAAGAAPFFSHYWYQHSTGILLYF
jgi:hypothetical protein